MVKILVVDDEPAIRVTLEDILQRDGYKVVSAKNGATALQLIATDRFDVALLDLNLGDMSGTEVLAALRRQAPDTVAIMLTAYASLETAVEALRQGAHDYLFKPYQSVQLRHSIRQGLLKRQRLVRQQALLQSLGQYLADNFEEFQAVMEEPASPGLSTPAETASAESQLPKKVGAELSERFLRWKGLIVDLSRHIVTLEGYLLELSPTEFNLLAYLVQEAPRVVPPQELIREVQGYEGERWEVSEIIRAHIYHIRQKIKRATGHAGVIQTVRGVGYSLSES